MVFNEDSNILRKILTVISFIKKSVITLKTLNLLQVEQQLYAICISIIGYNNHSGKFQEKENAMK